MDDLAGIETLFFFSQHQYSTIISLLRDLLLFDSSSSRISSLPPSSRQNVLDYLQMSAKIEKEYKNGNKHPRFAAKEFCSAILQFVAHRYLGCVSSI